MKVLKTLKEIVEFNPDSQVTVYNVLTRTLYHKKHGWVMVKIDEKLLENIIDIVVGKLGGYSKTKKRIKRNLSFYISSHWGLDRFIVDDDTYKVVYVAGQDEACEMRMIRKELSK